MHLRDYHVGFGTFWWFVLLYPVYSVDDDRLAASASPHHVGCQEFLCCCACTSLQDQKVWHVASCSLAVIQWLKFPPRKYVAHGPQPGSRWKSASRSAPGMFLNLCSNLSNLSLKDCKSMVDILCQVSGSSSSSSTGDLSGEFLLAWSRLALAVVSASNEGRLARFPLQAFLQDIFTALCTWQQCEHEIKVLQKKLSQVFRKAVVVSKNCRAVRSSKNMSTTTTTTTMSTCPLLFPLFFCILIDCWPPVFDLRTLTGHFKSLVLGYHFVLSLYIVGFLCLYSVLFGFSWYLMTFILDLYIFCYCCWFECWSCVPVRSIYGYIIKLVFKGKRL